MSSCMTVKITSIHQCMKIGAREQNADLWTHDGDCNEGQRGLLYYTLV